LATVLLPVAAKREEEVEVGCISLRPHTLVAEEVKVKASYTSS
jgi:hypothetical protein